MLRLPLDELNFSPDPGTPKDVCTPESPCDIGEGPCAGKDTCQNGLRCGTENCALFAGNNNNENCCYDPYRPGKIYSFPRLSSFTSRRGRSICLWSQHCAWKTNGKDTWLARRKWRRDNGDLLYKRGTKDKNMRWRKWTELSKCLRQRWFFSSFFSLSQPFSFSVTKIHYAFRDFEETQCDTDLFYRNTGLWEVDDICPAPKTWVAYLEPDYSTYSHQSLPSYSRGKRMAPQACEDINDVAGVRAGCNYSSLDLSKMCQGVDAKAIMKNALCCWFGNYISKLKANKELNVKGNSIKDACCEATKLKTGGTDPTPPAIKCPGQARPWICEILPCSDTHWLHCHDTLSLDVPTSGAVYFQFW